MKKIILTLVSLMFISAYADDEIDVDLSCRVTYVNEKLNNHVFEEGLGVWGDPDVDDDSEKVWITLKEYERSVYVGQKSFDTERGDRIVGGNRRKGNSTLTILVEPQDGSFSLRLVVSLKKVGRVLYREEGEKRYQLLARFDCRN